MATNKRKSNRAKIEQLDANFHVIDGSEIESGNVRVTLKNGVRIDIYTADNNTIYIDGAMGTADSKGNRHELILVGGEDAAFEISTRKIGG